MKINTLLVTSDTGLAKSVKEVVTSIGKCRLRIASRCSEAEHQLGVSQLALVFVHQADMEQADEVARLIAFATKRPRPVPVVVIADQYDTALAVRYLRLGAGDCLVRPLDMRRLALLVDLLTVRARQVGPYGAPQAKAQAVQSVGSVHSLIYNSPEMSTIIGQVRRVAPLNTSILLSGETGTGKTRLARLIHELSPRMDQPFVVADCGALSPSLAESELFGHVRGAFTGADRDRDGKFAAAARGTLMLDDIDALSMSTQAKLLRVVDERVFEQVGSNRTMSMQARIVVATNRCLEEEVAAGRFRSDLFYRVNVVAFHLPPLRQRRSVIPSLVEKSLAEFAAENGRRKATLSNAAMATLQAYDWPGNIRELRNVVERAVALCPRPQIEVEDLAEKVRRGRLHPAARDKGRYGGSNDRQSHVDDERHALVDALNRACNNRARAARELGISRVTLYKRLHKYRLV